jgi:hypothetical protein
MERIGSDQGEIEAVVRRYLARLALRGVPLLAGVVAVALALVLVQPVDDGDQAGPDQLGQAAAGSVQRGGLEETGPGATGEQQPADGAAEPAAPAADGEAPAAGTAGQPAAQAPAAGGGGKAPATTKGTRPGSGPGTAPSPVGRTGKARSGVDCRPGVAQVTWTPYAPPCVPAFHGSNGGATSPGVTAKQVTLSYRVTSSAQDAAISAATGDAAPPRDVDFLKDMQTYISYFNEQFETYGRQVVLKPYDGRGDYIGEHQGQGIDRAQADAATARGQGSFGDVTFQLRGSKPYWTALAQQKVVAWGPLGFPDSYYSRYAPYWWSATPSGSDVAGFFGNITCKRLTGLKAVFAPDPALAAQDRKFGFVHPDNPEYVEVANQVQRLLKGCGAKVERKATYAINVTQFQSQATSIVTQMRAAGVTTLLCYCDPVIPIFLGNAAQSQDYEPEWLQPYWGDAQARQVNNGNWQGVMSAAAPWPVPSKNEAYLVFKRASGGKEPVTKFYAAAYAALIQVYNGIQAAGPSLTPASLHRGYGQLPDQNGFAGLFRYRGGANRYAPGAQAPIGFFDPSHTSGFDGKPGGYRACDGGAFLSYTDTAAWGARRQPSCPGF